MTQKNYCTIFILILISSCGTTKSTLTNINGSMYKTYAANLSKNLSVSYIDEGSGDKTLILIHGLGSSKSVWAKNISVLRKNYRSIALDLPGYGTSSRGAWSYDMAFYSKAIDDFVDHMNIMNPILIGHSMGGQLTLRLLLDHPEKYKSAVLLAPAGIEQFTEDEATLMKRIYTSDIVKGATNGQIEANLKMNFNSMPTDAQFMIDERIAMKNETNFDAYAQMIPRSIAGMLDQPVYDSLENIKAPLLVIFGGKDKLIPNQFMHRDLTTEMISESATKVLTSSTVKTFYPCGHMLQWECAESVNEAIINYINGQF